MTIKTMDEYRARISRKPKRPSSSHTTAVKYFVAGFAGAAMAARADERKANKAIDSDKK
jgi:hypothetical protein